MTLKNGIANRLCVYFGDALVTRLQMRSRRTGVPVSRLVADATERRLRNLERREKRLRGES